MAAVGYYTTYEDVGVKEDISDIITNISPTQTPFLTSIGNEKVTQKLFQWQTDVLRPTNAAAVVEGVDILNGATSTANALLAVTPTVMLSNITQIFTEAVAVSGTVEATSVYGRAREMAYQLAKSSAALKRDLEVAMVGSTDVNVFAAGNDSTPTGRAFAGVQAQIFNPNVQVGGTPPKGPCYWMGTTAATGYLLAETGAATVTGTNEYTGGGLVQALEQVYINGGDPSVILASPQNCMVISEWVQGTSGKGDYSRTRMLDTGSKGDRKLVNVIDVYVSPFGEQKVVNDRFVRNPGLTYTKSFPAGSNPVTPTTNNTIVYDPDMWSLMTLRPWTRETLAKTGDSIKMMIVGEFSLKCKNSAAAAVLVDNGNSTSAPTMALGTF